MDELEAAHGADDEAKRRADAEAKARADADLQKRMPAILTDEERNLFADAQMKCDSAYQALGIGQAPHHAFGESLRNFQIRLLTPLKAHSKIYKDSNLGTIGDDAAFNNVAKIIVDDATAASTQVVTHGAPLRRVTKMNDSGHRVSEYFGDASVTWAPFAGGFTRFGTLNQALINKATGG